MPEIKRTAGSADYIFQRLAAGKPANVSLVGKNKGQAREWFRKQALQVTSVDSSKFISKSDPKRQLNYVGKQNVGQMLTFMYDAKLKKRLPYWDRFPLIFIVDAYNDGFLGINMHYLPVGYRASLMNALYRNINNDRNDESTRLLISYQILKSAAKYRYFKPCVKRYLYDHVGSKYVRILPDEWDMALMLPTERFQKAKKETVWMESVQELKEV